MKKVKLFLINIKPIIRLSLKIAAVFFTIIVTILSFISWDEMNIFNIWYKMGILIGLCILAFTISTILYLFVFNTVRIWSSGKNRVSAFYGDIIKMAFSDSAKNKGTYVIPVNDTFDCIIDASNEKTKYPLVSINTLHGQWLKRFMDTEGISVEDLNKRIDDNLSLNGYEPIEHLSRDQKKRGNLKVYKIGTICQLTSKKGNNFFLLAISSFDEKNNAHSTKRLIRDSVDKLMDFYDSKGQADPLYIPLMGTGNSRAYLSHKQSLLIIKNSILMNDKSIIGDLNIVVYKSDRDKVSIFDN